MVADDKIHVQLVKWNKIIFGGPNIPRVAKLGFVVLDVRACCHILKMFIKWTTEPEPCWHLAVLKLEASHDVCFIKWHLYGGETQKGNLLAKSRPVCESVCTSVNSDLCWEAEPFICPASCLQWGGYTWIQAAFVLCGTFSPPSCSCNSSCFLALTMTPPPHTHTP